MADNIVLFSPAKLNLFFRVLRRREDQFHEIASLFQTVAFGDHLTLALADKDELFCSNEAIPVDGRNLVFKALDLFRKKTGLMFHLKADIHKAIPTEAGLGGGSSNAATTLWGLNKLLRTNLDDQTLQNWSAEIGSDIPFFFSQGAAYCQGRGEIVENLAPLPMQHLFLAKPHFGLGTPEVYKNCLPESFSSRNPFASLEKFYQGFPEYFNDLETSAFKLSPRLFEVKEQLLSSGFENVVMTGSGTTFFCIGNNAQLPMISGVDFFSTQFLYREKEKWYEL